jgi:multiple sugar transport system ATP-binding protein
VSINGVNVNETRPSLRDLAMVFQSYALYPHLTVRQNLMTPLRLRDLSFWERFPLLGHLLPSRRAKMMQIEKEVRIVSETLKIEPLLARKPGQLSGGQRQRVALGRAMVRNPAAFLMDEPLSNLDASLRVHMRAELSALHKKLKTTFIYVTHDQAEALTLSDRIAVMMDGDLLQLGSPEEVYQNPQDIRVAEFIGSPKMNILPGHCDKLGHITCAGLSLDGVLANPAPGPVSVGFRPEHLTLTDADAEQSLSGKLTYKENLGSDVFFHVVQEGSESAIIIRAQPLTATPQKSGDTLHCAPVPGKPLVFGADGRRLGFTHAASSGMPA